MVNNFNLGRNVDETLRLVDAINFTKEHGELCPVNWQKGQEGVKASKKSISEYLEQKSENL